MDSPPEVIPDLGESRCGTSPPSTPYTEAELVATPSSSPPPEHTSNSSESASTFPLVLQPVPEAAEEIPNKSQLHVPPTVGAKGQPVQRPLTPSNTSVPDEHQAKVVGTPIKATVSSTGHHTGRPITGSTEASRFRRTQYAREMKMKRAEMEYEAFLTTFMPTGAEGDLPSSIVEDIPPFDRAVLLGTAEKPICESLCEVAQKIFDKHECPAEQRLVAKNTSHCPDNTDRNDYAEDLRGDICFYPTGEPAESAYKRSAPSTPSQASNAWAWVSLLVEVKTYHSDCAFGFEVKEPSGKSKNNLKHVAKESDSTQSGDTDPSSERGDSTGPHLHPSDLAALSTVLPSSDPVTTAPVPSVASHSARNDPESHPDTPQSPDQQCQAVKPKKPRKRSPVVLLPSGDAAQQSLGQIAEYVAKVFRRQHRLHFFTLYIYAGQARIIRWDRAGAIISTPFDFTKDPILLYRVIWRYACMTHVQRGYDPSAVLATKEEIEEMRTFQCKPHETVLAQARDNALDKPGWPVYKITMSPKSLVDVRKLTSITDDISRDEDSVFEDLTQRAEAANGVCFIVGRCYFASSSPTGRGTKGYIAYDICGRRLVFLKDCWRSYIDDETTPSEGHMLEFLRTHGVSNTPTPLAYEDVGTLEGAYQETYTQRMLARHEDTGCKPTIQRHYRLVIKEIGRPLEDHRTPNQLAWGVYHAFQAHEQACALELLHRDISPRNILLYTYIDANGRERTIGMLIDWDLAKFFKSLNRATQPTRSGTWQFMSARLLLSPGKKHEVADDIESFIHVFRWMCIRFYETTLGTNALRIHILDMYEASDTRADGQDFGGGFKRSMILQGASGFMLADKESALSELVDDLTRICQEHYLALESAATGRVRTGRVQASGPVRDPQSQTKQEALLRNLQKARAKKTALPPTYTKTLASHDAVNGAFAVALMEDEDAWAVVPKQKDRFLEFKDTPLFQHWFNNSSLQSSNKRPLESDSCADRPGPTKHARRETGSRLESVTEDVQATPPLLASK